MKILAYCAPHCHACNHFKRDLAAIERTCPGVVFEVIDGPGLSPTGFVPHFVATGDDGDTYGTLCDYVGARAFVSFVNSVGAIAAQGESNGSR